MPQTGDRIGRYIIRSRIGRGGMGEVFLADDVDLERKVALKILPENVADDEKITERFIREARAASALNHPNILTIHEIGNSAGVRFMASEYIDGVTLADLIAENPPSVAESVGIAVQIVSALAAAHAAGIVHRDIKPANIMVRKDGLVKILDFGIAKLVGSESNELTKTGAIIGTPNYMSPEQAEGQDVDRRSDLWSFGVVFHELLTGQKAFAGDSIAEVAIAVVMKEPTPAGELNVDVPASLDRIIQRLLRKNPEDRFESAAHLLTELNSAELESRGPAGGSQTPNNLGSGNTPLIGRESEIAEVAELLLRDEVRLLTLTGVGGTGKTRLSLAVAAELLGSFRDGVFFVELGAVTDPARFAKTVLDAIGARETAGKSTIESLVGYLSAKRILIVLDNFEQLADAAPVVAKLLHSSAFSKFLVTSRQLLRLFGEREYKVPALALPARSAQTDDLLRNDAVRLFVERARLVKPGFVVTGEVLVAVAAICRRLEGLPLAIEFAAARVRILSPSAILEKLENRLQILGGGASDRPSRQQTMRGALDWSFDLLTVEEQTLFRRLAVFSGGFGFDAAETVVGASEIYPASMDLLDGITSLLDKSLIFSKENRHGETRFQMLEIVRDYAMEKLVESGETEPLMQKHARFYRDWAATAAGELRGPDAVSWLEKLDSDTDNLSAAIDWAMEHDEETGIRLTAALSFFWLLRGDLTDGRRRLVSAAKSGVFIGGEVRFDLLYALGWINFMQARYSEAQKLFEEILIAAKTAGDLGQTARAARGLTNTLAHRGNFPAARRFCEEGLAASRSLGDERGVGDALNALGNLALMEDRPDAARPFYEESLETGRKLEHKQLNLSNFINLGTVCFYEGDLVLAREHYLMAADLAVEMGNRVVVSYCLDGFAAIAVEAGVFDVAAKLAAASEQNLKSISAEYELIEQRFRERFIGKLRSRMSESDFELFSEIGRRLDTAEALALAKSQPESISNGFVL